MTFGRSGSSRASSRDEDLRHRSRLRTHRLRLRRHRRLAPPGSSPAAPSAPRRPSSFPEKLLKIHSGLAALLERVPARLRRHREPLHRRQRQERAQARSRARRRHARRREAGLPVFEYTPAEVKLAVVGLRPCGEAAGAADGEAASRPCDAADAVRRFGCAGGCHLPQPFHGCRPVSLCPPRPKSRAATSWRHYRPEGS